MCPEMKNRKKLQRTHRSGKQTKYGSQWLDLVQHWCFFWELRQEPGMTPTSLIPQEAKVLGIDYPELCEKLIEVSLKKYQ